MGDAFVIVGTEGVPAAIPGAGSAGAVFVG